MTAATDATAWTARPRRTGLRGPVPYLLLAILVIIAANGAASAREIQRYREDQRALILPGATIAGVDVGGLDRDQAVAAVEEAISRRLDHVVRLRFGDRVWAASWRTLGATADVEGVVDRALEASADLTWWEALRLRYGDHQVPFEADIPIAEPHPGVRQWVEQVAAEMYVAPVDAQISWDRGGYSVSPSVVGREVNVTSTVTAAREQLRAFGDDVELFVEDLEPAVTEDRFRQVLFLDQSAHRLDFYEDGQVRGSYRVAVGTSGYPTPTGQFEVTLKRYLPTWVNPDPTGWGRSMPRRIGPGANNPLGLRALNWSVPNIRFHGTANVNSLGRDASHGCVRLSNADIVQLYDMVETGAIIISLG